MKNHRRFEFNMEAAEKIPNDILFDEIISTYNNPHHLMHKKMVYVLKHIQPADNLIDVGCGIGEFIVRLQDRFHTLVGNELVKVIYDIEELESAVREMLDRGKKMGKGKTYPERDALIKTIKDFVDGCP